MLFSLAFRFLASRLASVLAALTLSALALPAAAKNMFYVQDGGGAAWYVVLNSAEGKARLVETDGAMPGTYTDNGTEILVTLNKPISTTGMSANAAPCDHTQYAIRHDIEKVLFRRQVDTGVNKGKSQVVEMGHDVVLDGCLAGQVTAFGSLSDPGIAVLHRSGGSREPMTDVTAGLTIAGFREPPVINYGYEAADVVRMDTATTVHYQRSGHVFDAALSSDQWLVLQMPGFQRAYTRITINTSNGTETWIEAAWKDGKPQTVTGVRMTKPLPGANFGTKAATSRMWESGVFLGTSDQLFYYLYRDFTGERVNKYLVNGTETEDRFPITWRYEGLAVVTSRQQGSTLVERRWTPLGRTGKNMSVMEEEWRTPSGGSPYLFIPPRVIFYVDRGAAYPLAP